MTPRRVPVLTIVLLILASQAQGILRVRIDAVLKICDNLLMLIAGEDVLYLTFGQEVRTGKITEMEFPEPIRVNAAAMSNNHEHRLFYGPDFYYDRGVSGEVERFEYTPTLKEFFGNGGPDAAALRRGRQFYFKGCLLATYVERRHLLARRSLDKLGLPCSPDAAWTSEGGAQIILLKGDQIWIWDGKYRHFGPQPFSSVYNITSWELIPSDDKK